MTSLRSWLVPLILLGVIGYALAEDLTLTTYYPSPRGVYKEVRVTDRLAVGTTTPTAQVEVVAPAPITAVTTNQTTLAVRIPATTRFNTFDASLTNTAAAITNQAINSSGSNQLTNVGLSVSASGAERNYGLLVPQGQVGIGTTTPAATTALDVVGTLRLADGTQGADKVLTSDAGGVARWQPAPGGALTFAGVYNAISSTAVLPDWTDTGIDVPIGRSVGIAMEADQNEFAWPSALTVVSLTGDNSSETSQGGCVIGETAATDEAICGTVQMSGGSWPGVVQVVRLTRRTICKMSGPSYWDIRAGIDAGGNVYVTKTCPTSPERTADFAVAAWYW